ncbi:phosphorylated adapter RNA export protein [Microcaecilia unicolor]|uniref:Phosphorylated adapter RNA export protein n=1 Tax=Microcaecilia unicolor TaxID=1415580 RepID=A0A6P7X7Y7_9AMPH|nr:phosphorylated adapter RNA export protein [Microcaecilia unicolor]
MATAVAARGMEETEEGEISGSDSDIAEVMQHQQRDSEQKLEVNCTVIGFPTSTPSLVPSSHYRMNKEEDSTDESISDSDEEDSSLWKRKRQKCFNLPPVKPHQPPFGQSYPRQTALGTKKINNVWGSVLQEQNQEAVTTELGILGMDGQMDLSRQSEAYNYILARKLMEKVNNEELEQLNKQLDEYMQEDKKSVAKQEEEKGQSHLKRKRPVKERLGESLEMDYKGRCEITEEDSQEKVADEIAYRLREPKKELIAQVVKTIGKRKAIELLMETAEVEQNGGLFILNGSRRRTPGGVYLNLLKNTPSITEEQIKEIFYAEYQKEYENKKAAKKRRRQMIGKMKQAIKGLSLREHDDASRETFASDTNEALASLDDSQECHGDVRLDLEDAGEIDNSHNLETF